MIWNLLLSQTDHYKPKQVLSWFIAAWITIIIATRSQKTNQLSSADPILVQSSRRTMIWI